MRRTAEETAQTRQRLLESALTVFARKGYDAATLAEIGTEAGLTRGALYHHFHDKADIYLCAVTERWAMVGNTLSAELEVPGDPADRLRRFLQQWYLALETDPALHELLVVAMGPASWRAGGEPGYGTKKNALSALLDQLTAVCRTAGDSGQLRPSVHPEVAARIILTQVTGAVALHAFGLPAAHADEDLADVVLSGILFRRP